jgi:4-amino-4-deoxy-L-arabinose transferase-like glycosyltransferase
MKKADDAAHSISSAPFADARRSSSRLLAFRLRPSALPVASLLFVVALLPRVARLADFITTDEAYHWVDRVAGFSDALSRGRWAQTIQTGHPGVTTMWLGTFGQWLEGRLGPGWGDAPPAIAHLAWLRLPHALLEALAVPLAYALLRRLVPPLAAALAALLWAASPFLIAHGRLLHLDGLLTTFVTLSVLLLLCALEIGDRRLEAHAPTMRLSFTVLSGISAGLALITKGPALILLPFAGLLLVASRDWGLAIKERDWPGMLANLQSLISKYLLWLGAALLVVVLLWPALWVAPGAALDRYVGEIVSNGGRANGDGQFFLGQAVQDPGPLFYPVATLLRTTPAMLGGLLLFVVFGIRDWRLGYWRLGDWRLGGKNPDARPNHRHTNPSYPISNLRSPISNRATFALLAFVAFWTLVMTLGPKKFDRYVLPVWPALLVLAALGWGGLLEWARARAAGRWRAALGALCLALAFELAQLAWYNPYYLSYYNPLLGGGATAQRALLIGWGEGMDAVGAALRERPDIMEGPVLSALGATLQPFVPVPVKDVEELGRDPANYAVVYLESLQRAADPALYARLATTLPLRRVSIHGIDYATIYQLPRPLARPVGATFGDALRLAGVTVEYAPGQAMVTPAWDVRGRPAADYTMFVHIIDEQGAHVAGADVSPGGAGPPTSAWQPGEQRALPVVFPADLPPGSYRVVLGLYDAGGARLAVSGVAPADPALDGPNAVLVDTLVVQ